LSTGFTDPEHAETAFYQAFAGLAIDVMEAVWSSHPDAVCIHPGGPVLEGRAPILRSWAEIFRSADGPEVARRTLSTSRTADLAVHVVEERIGPRGAAASLGAIVIATNVYRREADGWRLVVHHASVPAPGRSHLRRTPVVH
jgi:ketosteroid isomerase-like protein